MLARLHPGSVILWRGTDYRCSRFSTSRAKIPKSSTSPRSVTRLSALAPSTAKLALIALSQAFRFAVRRGWTGVNPVMQ